MAIGIAFLLTVGLAAAAPPAPTPSPSPAKPYAEGDQAFRERDLEPRAREALKLFREYYDQHPDDPAAGWRLSAACYFVGLRLTPSKDEKKNLFAEGRDAGLFAAMRDDGCAPCHFWGAINKVLYGDAVGVFKMFFSLGDVKDHLKKSLQADPAYAYGGAYRLLGLIDQKLPGILGGDNDRAKEFFLKAIAAAPEEPLNYLFLARLLSEEFHDRAGALEQIQKGLRVPAPSAERVEAREALVELKELQSKLK